MIFFDRVSKIYTDKSVALDSVTLRIEPQEFVSVVGHSGAGKTTLLKMLLAEDRPSDGSVFFESTNIHELDRNLLNSFRRRIGTDFHDFRLLPQKTAFKKLAFAMESSAQI